MDLITFSTQVLTGQPLIIITPFGGSNIETMNTLISSLLRANINLSIYTDIKYPLDDITIPIYEKGPGIVFMTTVRDDFPNVKEIIPIYVISWSIRTNNINHYRNWVYPKAPVIIRMPLINRKNPPNIITYEIPIQLPNNYNREFLNIKYPEYALNLPDKDVVDGGWIDKDVINNLNEYSPKIQTLIDNISPPCVIYSPYVEKYGLNFIHEILKGLGIPIYLHIKDKENKETLVNLATHTEQPPVWNAGFQTNLDERRSLIRFIRSKYGILAFILINADIESLVEVPSSIPIHIVSLDSDSGMALFIAPQNHDTIHIYISKSDKITTSDVAQCNLLIIGINDSNRVFDLLLRASRELILDTYNNLYVR